MSNSGCFEILEDQATGPLTERDLYDFARIVSNSGGFARRDYLAEKLTSRFGFARLPHILRYEGARDYLMDTIEFVTERALQAEPVAVMACCQVVRTQEQAYAKLFPSIYEEFEAAVKDGNISNIAHVNGRVCPAPLDGWGRVLDLIERVSRRGLEETVTSLWVGRRAELGEKMVAGNFLNPGIVVDLGVENEQYVLGRLKLTKSVEECRHEHRISKDIKSMDMWTGQINE